VGGLPEKRGLTSQESNVTGVPKVATPAFEKSSSFFICHLSFPNTAAMESWEDK
jgi:hypothetical protein